MFTTLLSILPILTLSYKHQTSWDEYFRADLTCCPLHASNEDGCNNEPGSNCIWVSTDHEGYTQTGSRCLGQKFATCIAADKDDCCGGCCGCDKDNYNVPPAIMNPPPPAEGVDACGPAPAPPTAPAPATTAFTPILSGTPGDVGPFIDSARGTDTQCSKVNSENCWTNPLATTGQDYDYTPMDIYFTGVSKNSNGHCCYKYTSYKTDRKLCNGKNSDQSQLTLDVRCPTTDFEVILSESSDKVFNYDIDGSTCYYGIKIEDMCADQCNYEICINFKTTEACDYTESFVLDKAGNAFGFVSLDGLPTCTIPHHDHDHSRRDNDMFVSTSGLYYNGQFGGISGFGWMCFVVSVFMIFIIYKYLGKWCFNDYQYVSTIKDGNIKGYSTFSSV